MKKILLASVVLGAALAARAEDGIKKEFPLAGIKEVRVSAESGAIEVRAGEGLIVEIVGNKKPELCILTMETKDGALILKAESKQRWFVSGDGCGAGFRVSAPAGLALRARDGSGDIVLNGMSGEADLATGSGKISGTHAGPLTAKSGSGGVELKGLASGSDVKSGSGDVLLVWTKAPAQSVAIKIGSGNADLVFPAGTKLQAHQIAGSGTAVNTLGETPGAPLRVSIVTGSGDSTIRAAN